MNHEFSFFNFSILSLLFLFIPCCSSPPPSAEMVARKFAIAYFDESRESASTLAIHTALTKLSNEKNIRDKIRSEGVSSAHDRPISQELIESKNVSDQKIIFLFSVSWEHSSFQSPEARLWKVETMQENDFWKVSDFYYIAENEAL